MKKHAKFRIKIWIPILFSIQVLLDVKANLPETCPFLSAQMALVSTFFQMFIVLEMYNFRLIKKKFFIRQGGDTLV